MPSSADTLKTGDRIRIGSQVYDVTCVVPPSDGWGMVVELQRTSGSKQLTYTLMQHAKKPATFVLASKWQAREISGWTTAPAKKTQL